MTNRQKCEKQINTRVQKGLRRGGLTPALAWRMPVVTKNGMERGCGSRFRIEIRVSNEKQGERTAIELKLEVGTERN